ncbi:MAG TPA: hypothetical protein VGB77_12015 [Abditibacteriaceae bacterium]|jgi:hypothetical protein
MNWPRIAAIGTGLLALQHLYGAFSLTGDLLRFDLPLFMPAWISYLEPARESHTPNEIIIWFRIQAVCMLFVTAFCLRLLAERLWKRDSRFLGLALAVATIEAISAFRAMTPYVYSLGQGTVQHNGVALFNYFFTILLVIGLFTLPVLLTIIGLMGWLTNFRDEEMEQTAGLIQNTK